jgi:hypothetical protein
MKMPQNLIQMCLLSAVILPTAVNAQFDFTTNSDGSLNIEIYIGSGGAVDIPMTTNGLSVTSIGEAAFYNKTSLTSVMIPDSIISIGTNAFHGCTDLTNVTIGTNVTSIGDWAFSYCPSLTSLTIPDSVTNIGNITFAYSSGLTSVTLGTNLVSIGLAAFDGCSNLTSVTIPNSVTSIGPDAFGFCFSLTNVTVGTSVTNIEDGAFVLCTNLTSVTIPNSVLSIGNYGFELCSNLTGVYFEGNAPSLGSDVFYSDNNATAFYMPGTTGWSTFNADSGLSPAVQWNPQAQTGDGSFGVQVNGFGFNIAGSSNLVIVVEACTNLANPVWSPVSTNTLNNFIGTNGTSYFSDPQWTNYPARFYGFSWPRG